jgi:hypothetical protein
MNDAQRNIINIMMGYDEWSWGQPGDYGYDVNIYADSTIERNYMDIMRVVPHATCIVVERHEGEGVFGNAVESFSFECRFPVHHYVHYVARAWWNSDGEMVPFQTGEIDEIAQAFARAFELPLRYINKQEEQ